MTSQSLFRKIQLTKKTQQSDYKYVFFYSKTEVEKNTSTSTKTLLSIKLNIHDVERHY